MNLGNSLFHARKRRGLSQEDVAEKLGVSRQTISKWETDREFVENYRIGEYTKYGVNAIYRR